MRFMLTVMMIVWLISAFGLLAALVSWRYGVFMKDRKKIG